MAICIDAPLENRRLMIGFFSKSDIHTTKTIGRTSRSSCFSCGLYKNVHSPKMEPYGNFKKRIMVIGEAPGEREDENGKPFQGRTGRLLVRTLDRFGIDLFEDCISLNAVNCRPPENRAPTNNEINCCRDVKVIKAIEMYKPVMILVLGGTALTSVVGPRVKKLGGIMKWAGRRIPDQVYKAWVCPTFHPSYVEREDKSPEIAVIWENDLKNAFAVLDRPFPVHKDPPIHYLNSVEEVRSIVTDCAAFDYEATGIKPHKEGHRIICASIAYRKTKTSPIEVAAFMMPSKKSEREAFLEFIESKIKKVASNLKYETNWTKHRLKRDVRNWYHDTMLAAHVIDHRPGTTSLKFQAYVYFGVSGYDDEVGPYLRAKDDKSNSINQIHKLLDKPGGKQELLYYCALDSYFELLLAEQQIKELEEYGLTTAYNLIHQGIQAFARAEQQGIRVDLEQADKMYLELQKKINELDKEFKRSKLFKHWQHSVGGKSVNIGSNFQLAHFLYKVKKLTPKKMTPSGQGAVDDEALQSLDVPELKDLLRLRKLKKMQDYLNGFLIESVDGFIHPVFNLHTVSTYRSSSDSPNFQNIPVRDEEAKKIIRSCLFPRKGHQLLEVDFKGIEVGIAACYHKDPTMIKYIKDPKSDMHGDMAQQIFFLDYMDKSNSTMKTLRGGAKNGFVFPQFYGDYYGNNALGLSEWAKLPLTGKYRKDDGLMLPSDITVAQHLINNGIKSIGDFTEHLKKIEEDFWNRRFPVYNEWRKKWWKKYQQKGYFDMHTGFRCYGVMERNHVINYPVQGAAFHCLLWSFITIDKIIRKEKLQTRLIGQVHDSIVFDVYPPELEYILSTVRRVTEVDLLEHWDWIIVPLTTEVELCQVDESWYHKKELKRIE